MLETTTNSFGVVTTSQRSLPWHSIPNAVAMTERVNTREFLASCKLDNWNVRVDELPAPEGYFDDESFFMTSRAVEGQEERQRLAIVKSRYSAMQNEDLFLFGDAILDGGATWESGGSFKNGRVVFGSLLLDEPIKLDADDSVMPFLLVSSSHDGSSSITASLTGIRVYCQNSLNMALKTAKQGGTQFRIKHTQAHSGRVTQAREALGLARDYFTEFEQVANNLISREVTNAEFAKIIELAYPQPEVDVKGSLTKWENKRDALVELWTSDTNANITGTAWGAYQALTEQVLYGRAPRAGKTEPLAVGASGFDGAVNATNQKLFDLVQSVTA